MSRMRRDEHKVIGKRFSSWFKPTLRRLGLTPGVIVYRSRKLSKKTHWDTELTTTTVRRYLSGKSIPSLETALRLARLLRTPGKQTPSTLEVLFNSYPYVIMQIVQGLDAMGLDEYWSSWDKHRDQETRREIRYGVQRELAESGNRIISLARETKPLNRRKHLTPSHQLRRWGLKIAQHKDLLAICVAYTYFSGPFNDSTGLGLRQVFSIFNPSMERTWREALSRYPTYQRENSMNGAELLAAAEDLIANESLDMWARLRAVPPLLSSWCWDFAEEFIRGLPLFLFVDEFELRDSLDVE